MLGDREREGGSKKTKRMSIRSHPRPVKGDIEGTVKQRDEREGCSKSSGGFFISCIFWEKKVG